jgi:hypothetical protein
MTSIGTLGGAIASALIFAASAAAQPALPPKHVLSPDEAPPPTGVSGTARAEALILPGGSIARSKGVVSVNHFGNGRYCVKLKSTISASTALPVLTIDYDHSPDAAAVAQYRPLSCTTGNNIGVTTLAAGVGGWGAQDEAFVIVVP